MSDPQQTVSVPSLLLLAALGALAVRYFFFSPATSTSSSSSSSSSRINLNDIQQISSMFPQVSRRDIAWDLQRRGGSVVATTERILTIGRLDPAPPTFQPNLPTQPGGSAGSRTTSSQLKSDKTIDLIQRYNLGDRASAMNREGASSSSISHNQQQQPLTRDQSKGERQASLQRRREEMILDARRKMEASLKTGNGR